MPRIIDTSLLIPIISSLAIKASCELDPLLIEVLKTSYEKEESPYGRDILYQLIENAGISSKEMIASCQDTGACMVFLEIGQEVSWIGMPLNEAVNEGVRQGYTAGNLRMSMVRDPINRINTGDNTPAILHTEIIPGEKVKIAVMPKGGGSENQSAFTCLNPAEGREGIIKFILETVENAGGKPCPPLIIGVGLGGTMDYCAYLSKKALLRPMGERNGDPFYAELESELLERVNRLGIGPMGLGGRITALDVRIESYACHITSLPIAINLQCHSYRLARSIL
ncbi:MAG: fumarate hydratase [Treponema sp.]|nr:fumarate hydratase [Treponema sp.]